MNLRIFTRVMNSIKAFTAFGLFIGACQTQADDWKFDFSRRVKETRSRDLTDPSVEVQPEKGFITTLFDSSEPVQELVILNTDKGFVPRTVRVRQGGFYRIHVVNVNEQDKNISFVLDAFSEHHATYFGKIKTFEIRPQKDGIFRFVSPETSAQGRLVVFPAAEPAPAQIAPAVRMPSAEQ